MRNNRLASIAVFTFVLLVPVFAFGQFGGLTKKKKKFNTKPAKALLKKMDGTVAKYEEGTLKVRTATETTQTLVDQYADGDFPVLTQTWANVKKSIDEAKDEAQKSAAFKLRDDYFREMAERKKAMDAALADPVKAADLGSKFQAPEKEQLAKIAKELKGVPEKDAAILKDSKGHIKEATKVMKSLTKQAATDPLRAKDYTSLNGKLKDGVEKLGKINGELDKQVKAVNDLIGNIGKLIK